MNVPKLRFPDFSGEWDVKRLKNVSKEITRTSNENVEVLTISAGKGFIRQKDRWNRVMTGNSLKKYIFLKKNEFSYNRGNSKSFPYGCIYRLKYNSALVPYVYRSFSIEQQNPLYYEQFFIGGHIDRQLNKIISSSARMDGLLNISKKDFFDVKIPVPIIQEQRKIGNFLSKVDEKIEKLEKKLELWKIYKKGMMQNIFSQELRFKDENGEDFPEWTSTILGQIANIYKGFTPSTRDSNNWDGGILWLSIANMNQGKYIDKTSKTITKKGSKGKRITPKGSLIMSFKLTLGRLGILKQPMYTNEAICSFEWKNSKISSEYMYYYLSSIDIRKFGSQAAKGVTLNNDGLNSIVVKIPQIYEQKMIADFLSAFDTKIDLLNKELQNNVEFKKGLLQQMFPTK